MITYNTKSIWTGEEVTLDLNCDAEIFEAAWHEWKYEGRLAQDAFHFLDADEREFIMTGTLPGQWEEKFSDEDYPKVTEAIPMTPEEGLLEAQAWGYETEEEFFAIMDEAYNKAKEDELHDIAQDLFTAHCNEVDYHMSDRERDEYWDSTAEDWYAQAQGGQKY